MASPASEDPLSTDALLGVLYKRLRHKAAEQLSHERMGHTLCPTALVHEVWIDLSQRETSWETQRQFYAAASQAMRRILIDGARSRNRDKRGGRWLRVTLNGEEAATEVDSLELLALDEALDELETEFPRSAEIARYLIYAGLNQTEIGAFMQLSPATMGREVRFLRGRLGRALKRAPGEPGSDR